MENLIEKKQLKKKRRLDRFDFGIQWHVTAACDQKCKHCYMYDSPFYESEVNNELTLEQCKAMIDDFASTLKRWKIKSTIAFTGGDPILRKDFFDILKYAQLKGFKNFVVMGNSYHINKRSAIKLKEHGVFAYQISLDGLQETHDKLRKPGSFEDTLRAYEVLKEVGIKPVCMYTVSKLNMNELVDVIQLVAKIGLAAFDFDRLVPVGLGAKLKDEIISPLDYRDLLIKADEEYKRLEAEGCKTEFGHKDNMWYLLYNEKVEKPKTFPSSCNIDMGCLIGWAGVSILADGSVMACRRLPMLIGKMPEQSLSDIFIDSPELNEMRETERIENCGDCVNHSSCRGCRAIAFGASGGDYFAKDPQCWKCTEN